VYLIRYKEEGEPIEAYSKKFADPSNPSENFVAVMVCSDAEEACPFVPGATVRISITYDDPKSSDGTAREQETYDERSAQIAREMGYLLHKLREQIKV
jgi:arsenate reductase (thioredoxin)